MVWIIASVLLVAAAAAAVFGPRVLGHRGTAQAAESPSAEVNVEGYLLSRSETVFERFHAGGFESLDDEDKVFVAIWSLDSQVNNGGFDQYFFNQSGDLWPQTLAALKTIGSQHVLGLLEQAIAVFPDSRPARDNDERRDQLLAFGEEESERFNALDTEFYQSTEYLGGLLYDYLMRQ